MGLIAEYLSEMGADAKVLKIASQANSSSMVYSNSQTLEDTGCLTPINFNEWFIEPYKKWFNSSLSRI